MELGLSGKVALVTGGTRGIGRSIAEHLLDEGAHVAICSRSDEHVTSAIKELTDRGVGRVIGETVDVSDAERLASWVGAAADALGGVDILVPNVSAAGGPDKWQANYETDVLGTVRAVEAALPLLQASDAAAITIISSTAAVETFRGPTAYAAFKAALLNYAKNLSRELAPSGVRVNSVIPGPVYFDGGPWEAIKKAQPEVVASLVTEIPMGRMAAPADIARAVTFLSSPAAEYITGAALVVDGGFLRRVQL